MLSTECFPSWALSSSSFLFISRSSEVQSLNYTGTIRTFSSSEPSYLNLQTRSAGSRSDGSLHWAAVVIARKRRDLLTFAAWTLRVSISSFHTTRTESTGLNPSLSTSSTVHSVHTMLGLATLMTARQGTVRELLLFGSSKSGRSSITDWDLHSSLAVRPPFGWCSVEKDSHNILIPDIPISLSLHSHLLYLFRFFIFFQDFWFHAFDFVF